MWIVATFGIALGTAAAIAFGLAGQPGAATPDSPEVVARTAQYVGYDRSVTLTPDQERTRAAALEQAPSPCCRNHTMGGTCCKCTLSKTVSGLAKHLIGARGYGATQVRAAVIEWLRFADKDGFPGHACSTRDGCGRPFNQHGCGGMDGRRSS